MAVHSINAMAWPSVASVSDVIFWMGNKQYCRLIFCFFWSSSNVDTWYADYQPLLLMLSCCISLLLAGGQSVCVHQFFWNSNLLCQNCTQYCWSICWPKAGCISRDDGNDDAGKDDDVDDDDGDDVDDDSNMWWWCGYRLAEHYLPPWESSFLPVQSQYLDTLPATHRHKDQVFGKICLANYQKCQFWGVKKQLLLMWDVWLKSGTA